MIHRPRNGTESNAQGVKRLQTYSSTCDWCGADFEPYRPQHKFCSTRCRVYAHVQHEIETNPLAQRDLFTEPSPVTQGEARGLAARDQVASKDENQRALELLKPIARRLAREAAEHGITVADVLIEAKREGIVLPEKKDFLGALGKEAGLTATDRMRKSPIERHHGRRHVVWSL